jgi:hypothetical protein
VELLSVSLGECSFKALFGFLGAFVSQGWFRQAHGRWAWRAEREAGGTSENILGCLAHDRIRIRLRMRRGAVWWRHARSPIARQVALVWVRGMLSLDSVPIGTPRGLSRRMVETIDSRVPEGWRRLEMPCNHLRLFDDWRGEFLTPHLVEDPISGISRQTLVD